MFLAPSLDEFKNQFSQGLIDMLGSDSLGGFILVLANSMQDEKLFNALQPHLQLYFQQFKDNTPEAPFDDLDVFQKLTQSGIESLGCWEYFHKDSWELVYNPLRALRPARASQEQVGSLRRPFDANKFHFNKPFLKPEILWEGSWKQKNFRVLYNKFPFSPWHLLIVPEPEKEQPQFLTEQAHKEIFSLSTECSHLPGFGIAYNSIGAYASVNQLHFQGFIRKNPLPIESMHWTHNGGSENYPLNCQRFDEATTAWIMIQALNHRDQPYNLLYRNGFCYVIPQKGQGKTTLPECSQGAGWHEMCGVFTLADNAIMDELNADAIYQMLKESRAKSDRNS